MTTKEINWREVLVRLDRAIGNSCFWEEGRWESYPYIPLSTHLFTEQVIAVRGLLPGYPKFVDVGCGVGTKLLIAEQLGFECYGLEIDPKLARIAAQMRSMHIECCDAVVADYQSYDVIYFYCPLRSQKLEVELEQRIIDTAKPGALVLGNLKCGGNDQARERLWGKNSKVELVRGLTVEVYRKVG